MTDSGESMFDDEDEMSGDGFEEMLDGKLYQDELPLVNDKAEHMDKHSKLGLVYQF